MYQTLHLFLKYIYLSHLIFQHFHEILLAQVFHMGASLEDEIT